MAEPSLTGGALLRVKRESSGPPVKKRSTFTGASDVKFSVCHAPPFLFSADGFSVRKRKTAIKPLRLSSLDLIITEIVWDVVPLRKTI
jgi:hypothetical protein